MSGFGRILILFSFLPFAACSVKENRFLCPCRMSLEVSGGEESLVTLSLWDGLPVLWDSLRTEDSSIWARPIPRGRFTVSALSGLHGVTKDGKLVKCVPGDEMGPVYAGTTLLDSSGEECGGSVRLRRQSVYINIRISASDKEDYPYEVDVRGNVDGFDIVSLEPHHGPFTYTLHPVVGSWHRVCVPRQTDNSLNLVFKRRPLGSDITVTASIPIGDYIKSSGYDWYSEDLEDIDIDIDYADASIEVCIDDWNIIGIVSDL